MKNYTEKAQREGETVGKSINGTIKSPGFKSLGFEKAANLNIKNNFYQKCKDIKKIK